MMRETPTIAASAYGSATTPVNLAQFAAVNNAAMQQLGLGHQQLGLGHKMLDWQHKAAALRDAAAVSPYPITKEEEPMANQRRLVQVFIADPDDNVPLADALIYRGEPVFTDLTDQELFFDIDLKGALDAHNAKRTKMVNKKVKERTEHLEPARIRDLKMTVVNIATF